MLGIFVIPGVQLPTAAKLFGRESRGDVAAEYALALRGAAIAIPFVLRIYPTTIAERQSWHALVILELARSTVIGMWNLTLVQGTALWLVAIVPCTLSRFTSRGTPTCPPGCFRSACPTDHW